MTRLLEVTRSPWFWLALLLTCGGLEAGALFYQHVLHYLPCQLCIYVRVWVLAIGLVSALTLLLRHMPLARGLGGLAGLGLSLGLAHETWLLFKVEYGVGDGGSCGFFANFPSWAPLDKWLPVMFEVQELCQATPEIVFGITMTHSLMLVSLVLLTCFSCALIAATTELSKQKA